MTTTTSEAFEFSPKGEQQPTQHGHRWEGQPGDIQQLNRNYRQQMQHSSQNPEPQQQRQQMQQQQEQQEQHSPQQDQVQTSQIEKMNLCTPPPPEDRIARRTKSLGIIPPPFDNPTSDFPTENDNDNPTDTYSNFKKRSLKKKRPQTQPRRRQMPEAGITGIVPGGVYRKRVTPRSDSSDSTDGSANTNIFKRFNHNPPTSDEKEPDEEMGTEAVLEVKKPRSSPPSRRYSDRR